MLKVIITGTSGMVGKGVLLECLDSPEVEKVLIVNRRSIGHTHEKLTELLVSDFMNLSSIEPELAGYDACYFCLGISAAGQSEESYTAITFDLTLHFADTLLARNPDFIFCYVSGDGTDSKEKSVMMWARVKGKTENTLLERPFKDAYMFRPGIIEPKRGVEATSKSVNFFYKIMRPIFPFLQKFKGSFTDTSRIGLAMINVTLKGNEKKVLTIGDINALAE